LSLAGAGAAYFCILTYVLAVHPTPRMFLPIACLAAFAIGIWAGRNREPADRKVAATMAALLFGLSAMFALSAAKLTIYEEVAEGWLRESPGFALGRTEAQVFALSPSLAALPIASGSAASVLLIGPACKSGRPTRYFLHRPDWPLPYDWAQRLRLAPKPLPMCLISRAGPAAAPRP